MGQEEIGFVKDIRIKNAIFSLRMISKQAIQMQRNWYLRFKDGGENISWTFVSQCF